MIKVIELFSGVGSQRQALKNIGVEHEVVGIAEIDKYAISSYMQLHGETHNFGDISKIDNLPGADLWTYSFPCQDLSVAGKGAGIKKGTRSGLLFEVERLLEVSEKPKYLLMENVKNLVGKKNKPDFDRWCQKLEELGYKNYWQVLNAKDYGVPQNRERVFMISILDEENVFVFPKTTALEKNLQDMLEKEVVETYFDIKNCVKVNFDREFEEITKSDKDIYYCKSKSGFQDNRVGIKLSTTLRANNSFCCVLVKHKHKPYVFPGKEELKIRLKDVLENKVEEKYFINKPWMFSYDKDGKHDNNEIARLINNDFKTTRTISDANKLCRCLDTMGGGQREPKVLVVANLKDVNFESERRIFSKNEICPTLLQRDCKGPKKILVENKLSSKVVGEVTPNSQAGKVYDSEHLSPTLCAGTHGYAQGCIKIKNATKKGFLEATPGDYTNLQFSKSETRRGRVIKECSGTLMCNDNNGVLEKDFRIRKLTPRECWRLMGWKDEEFNKIQGISNSQLYKQAGNGIVVTVLEKIFKNMF